MEMHQMNMQDRYSRIPFSQKLFWSVFLMFLGFTGCFLIFQYQREREFAQEKLNTVLINYNHQLYQQCREKGNVTETVRDFIRDIPHKELRITIIAPDGQVLFDNSGAGPLENHNDRSEVAKARLYKEGFVIRSSTSTGKRYFYSASLINNYIFRSALPYDATVRNILAINKDFLYFMALMIVICFFVLSNFTFSIGQTISKLRDFASNIKNGQVPAEEYAFPNDELGDISKDIVSLYHRVQRAKNELSLEREKLIKHFQYAKEGFAMFSGDSREILSNTLFIQFANLIADLPIHEAEEVLDIPELEPIHFFLLKHVDVVGRKRKVMRESLTVDKNGKIFQVECILFQDNSYEISINDISRQEEESRMKRQLTQHISHELKTPVSSIQGYLETILSTPQLPDDKRQFFLERCYSQSTRLTGLLRDMSVLNRLDEAGTMFDLAEVDLTSLVEEIEQECSKEMEEKRITTEVQLPARPVVFGNHSLLYSIFRNLFDNAIAYAGEGIQIRVVCYKEDPKYYYFSFSDNGVGISEEHINRIFERFYRVDKGRSRKLGGTGLGLSIVKNAILFHKGQISAKSSPGKGVTFFFTLKKKI